MSSSFEALAFAVEPARALFFPHGIAGHHDETRTCAPTAAPTAAPAATNSAARVASDDPVVIATSSRCSLSRARVRAREDWRRPRGGSSSRAADLPKRVT
jgi:hypothetical protein